MFDDEYYYFPDEETIRKENYEGYELSDFHGSNLKEIEKELKEKKINSKNKGTILEYLQKLYGELSMVKKQEYPYEGESNFNINRDLQRVKKLIEEVEKI